ncbi:MAG: nucleotide disphospho-sugar-binding domain-containing protein [Candidatus Omnitrophota bacterium]
MNTKRKVLLISLGTRGDIEPFLAIAEMLKEKGHNAVCAFPEQFENLALDSGAQFISLGPEFVDLIESDDGAMAMGGQRSIIKKMGAYARLYMKSLYINKELVARQREIIVKEQPDKIIFSGKAIYPIIWEIENPGKSILVSPIPCLIHAVNDRPTVGFSGNYGQFLNKLTYSLSNFGLIQYVMKVTKEFRKSPKISSTDIKKAIFSKKMIYTVSPTIFPRPDYWPENTQVLGYHERKKTAHWHPNKRLEKFVADREKILFVTFGSMANPEPEEKTKMIVDILERCQIPAIINTASGGLVELTNYNSDLIHFESGIPYEWIFPKMYAALHHGGSGTTHLALKYGCASMIIPHIIDQYLWDNLISDLGVGPMGISMAKITRQKLETKILDLFHNQSYKANALKASAKMKNEDFKDRLCKAIVE